MGRSVNKVTLIGRIGSDLEITKTNAGKSVLSFSIATDESYNDKATGQKVEQTEWHRVVVYDKAAETIQAYAKKGNNIYVEGKLKTREWEKDGIKRYTTEIVVSEFTLLEWNGNQQPAQPQYGNQQPVQPQYGNQQPMQPQYGNQQPMQPQYGNQQPMQPNTGGYNNLGNNPYNAGR